MGAGAGAGADAPAGSRLGARGSGPGRSRFALAASAWWPGRISRGDAENGWRRGEFGSRVVEECGPRLRVRFVRDQTNCSLGSTRCENSWFGVRSPRLLREIGSHLSRMPTKPGGLDGVSPKALAFPLKSITETKNIATPVKPKHFPAPPEAPPLGSNQPIAKMSS